MAFGSQIKSKGFLKVKECDLRILAFYVMRKKVRVAKGNVNGLDTCRLLSLKLKVGAF